jgi:histidine ammonia-lyase
MNSETHIFTLKNYHLEDIYTLLKTKPQLKLSSEIEAKIRAGAQFVRDKTEEDQYIYGVNTGFGSLCETRVDPAKLEQLQYNIIVSHTCGIGEMA